jgi:general secretion pathway protein J
VRPPRHNAFTLLELLVATAMVAVLAGALYAAMHSAIAARRSATDALVPQRRVEAAMDLIARDLRGAMPAIGTTGAICGTFVGTVGGRGLGATAAPTLTLFTTSPGIDSRCPGELRQVELTTETEPSGVVSIIRRETANLLAPVTPEPVSETVCRGVSEFALRYCDGSSWQDTWDSSAVGNALPKAVEVTIQLAPPADQPAGKTMRLVRVLPVPCGSDAAVTTVSGTATGGGT